MMNAEEMIKAARPAREPGWSEGPQGKRMLHRVLADSASTRTRIHRRLSRPVLVAGVGLVTVTAATGAAVLAFAPEPPPDWKVPGDSIACAAERTEDADLSIHSWRAGDDPVDTCRRDLDHPYGCCAGDVVHLRLQEGRRRWRRDRDPG